MTNAFDGIKYDFGNCFVANKVGVAIAMKGFVCQLCGRIFHESK